MKKENVARAWVWSSRAWMVHVGLELGRLGYEARCKNVKQGQRLFTGTMGEKAEIDAAVRDSGAIEEEDKEGGNAALEIRQDKEEMESQQDDVAAQAETNDWWQRWNKDIIANAAYAPMTVHYSLENGILSEGPIAALGVMVAWCRFGHAWKASA